MKQGLRFSMVALMLSIAAPIACGVTEGNSGSNTNWLSICTDDDDCTGGYSCLCGVCTSPCELDGDGCLEASAQCTALAEVGCAPRDEHENACLPSCSDDDDCDQFGDGLACETGVCVAATSLDDPLEDLELPDLEPLSGTPGLALGANSACVTRAGRVWCWGSNEVGQAAQAPGAQQMPIAEVEELEGVTQVVASAGHKCALTEAGSVFCWGLNDRGQVGPTSAPAMTCSVLVLDRGPEDVPCQPTPTQVPGIQGAIALALNDVLSCALFDGVGSFTCWGDMNFSAGIAEHSEGLSDLALDSDSVCVISRDTGGVLCDDGEHPEFTHDTLSALELAVDVESGTTYGCALDVNGRVDCWGRDDAGQRGLGSFGSPVASEDDPPAVASGARQVGVGQNHACARLRDGTVSCWGRNDFGQTGAPPSVAPRCAGMPCQPSPTPVAGIPPAADLASRANTTCALSEDAELYCWGGPDSGSAWRIPGPWEGGKNSCDRIDQAIAEGIHDVRTAEYVYTSCETDDDCVEVELGVSCHRGCQSAPMHTNQASEMATELARIEDTYCSSAEQLDCSFARPECPSLPGELACVEGACVRFDADATGCDDVCACKVLENLANEPPIVEQQCEGHHLMLHRFVPCARCGVSRLYFAVANYGQTAFEGDATIELTSDTDQPVSDPLTVTLSLEPGQHSEPLHFEFTRYAGAFEVPGDTFMAVARLVVADNCDYMSESSEVSLEVPTTAGCPE